MRKKVEESVTLVNLECKGCGAQISPALQKSLTHHSEWWNHKAGLGTGVKGMKSKVSLSAVATIIIVSAGFFYIRG